MQFVREFGATLDVHDVKTYSADPDRVGVDMLRRNYEGRCFRGVFVVRIVGIVERAACRYIFTNRLTMVGSVDLVFSAVVVEAATGDLVANARIADTGAKLLIGQTSADPNGAGSAGAGFTVQFRPVFGVESSIRVGQLVPAWLEVAYCGPGQSQIAGIGVLLVCDRKERGFRLEGALSEKDVEGLAPLAAQLRAALEDRAVAIREHPERVDFFDRLLYTFRDAPAQNESKSAWSGPGTFPGPEGASVEDLLKTVARPGDVGGVWCRGLSLHRSSPLVHRARGKTAPWTDVVDASPFAAFAFFLRQAHNYARVVSQLARTFSDPELFESHQNIWQIMQKFQVGR